MTPTVYIYLIAGLAFVALWLYGLYQRSQRQRAEVGLATTQKALVQAQADEAAQRARYEALVTDLKAQVQKMEEAFDALATPDAVRARFAQLFPRPAAPHAAGTGVPAGAPADARAGGDGSVPAGK